MLSLLPWPPAMMCTVWAPVPLRALMAATLAVSAVLASKLSTCMRLRVKVTREMSMRAMLPLLRVREVRPLVAEGLAVEVSIIVCIEVEAPSSEIGSWLLLLLELTVELEALAVREIDEVRRPVGGGCKGPPPNSG